MVRTGHTGYFLQKVEIKDYNMIDDGKLFDQLVRNDIRSFDNIWYGTYGRSCDNIWKIAMGQGDDYTAGCLLVYSYFKENYKLTAIELSKQQALNSDPKTTK